MADPRVVNGYVIGPGADLYGTDLRGAHLYGTNLRDADLTDANLRDADLRGTHLDDANRRCPFQNPEPFVPTRVKGWRALFFE